MKKGCNNQPWLYIKLYNTRKLRRTNMGVEEMKNGVSMCECAHVCLPYAWHMSVEFEDHFKIIVIKWIMKVNLV
jgi:hypothetical protein